jgi:hypothetical protein
MTSQPHPSAFRSAESIESFCDLRSQFIDEFARLELAASLCLEKLGLGTDARKSTFTDRVALLSKAKPSSRLSKENAATLATLGRDCEPHKRLRASVVHSVMEFGTRNDETVALFRNVADIVCGEPVYNVLAASDFRDAIQALKAVRRRVEGSLNPCGPSPPKPAATGSKQ